MKYSDFVSATTEEVRRLAGKDMRVEFHAAKKNNGKERIGIAICSQESNVTPAIYLEEYYKMYQLGNTIAEIAHLIIKLYGEVKLTKPWNVERYREYDWVRVRLVSKLINYGKNKGLLKECPHRRYLDLAIVYYLLIEETPQGTATMLVKNEHMEAWGVAENALYKEAMENAERLLPARLQSMTSVMEELINEKVIEDKECEKLELEDAMYVLTNIHRNLGANCILYQGELKRIAKCFRESYYILPSSIHEVIIVPVSKSPTKEELETMIEEINETQVEDEEILSNHAYFYDIKRETLLY
ncbi:MAG: DUF5688 family protein [Eubacteriales bacterium]